jgi:photosystem II stability/assembly factor-like uncharacterized protein
VLAVTGVAGEPDHFYFGAVNGGVWETRDTGRTWEPIFDSAPVGAVGALAVAPSDHRTIYVGTGESDMRSNIAQGAGLFRSSDGGRTWQPAGLADSQQIGRIIVDPHDPKILLVAALGHPYGPNEMRGVFRSTDGGQTWERTLYRDADTGAIDLALDPSDANVVYAALWQTRRPPWNVYPPSSGPGSGLYKSVDGGRTWAALAGHGLPAAPGRIGLAVAPSEHARVYAVIDATEGGLYRSDDAGATWTHVGKDARIWKRGWYFGGVTVDPSNPDIVYLCNIAMYRSTDGGRSFAAIKGAPGGDDYHQLWIDPNDPGRQILGVDQGAVITVDGGTTWSSWFNQPTGQFYHVSTDNRFPYWIYGSQQDSGAAGIPSRSEGVDGINLTHFRELTAGGESDNVAPDPDDPDLLFGGRVEKLDQRTGQTQLIDPTIAFPDLYRGEWTLPLVFSKTGRRALYFGNQRIFRTYDRGAHWEPISPDLSRESPTVPRTLDPTTAADDDHGDSRRGVVYAIGTSMLDANVLWAGTDDGLVWTTADGGAHWRNVTPKAMESWSKIGVVEPSHFDVRSAYLAVDRHRVDDPHPYVYRTHDGGTTWTLIANGIADGGPINSVNVVREDPIRRGLLYCGTERGVYVSFDDGDHWQPLQANLPRTSVRDIDVHGADLVIATHGRGFWIMDDVTPLRALDPSFAGAKLIRPSTATRLRPSGFMGTPVPLDEPRGANPRAGAVIDYVLEDATPVSLTITDARGAFVRRFASTDPVARVDLARVAIAPEWLPAALPLASGPGAHRFVWNLRYLAPAILATGDPSDEEQGVAVPPGRYFVELQVGDRRMKQPLDVVVDPRVHLAAGAAQRQAALSRRIEKTRVAIATANLEAEHISAALSRIDVAAPSALADAVAIAQRRIAEIADLAPPLRSPDSTGADPRIAHGFRHLGTSLRVLAKASEGADSDPGADLTAGFQRQSAVAGRALATWTEFKTAQLVDLNSALAAAGQDPISP